MKNQIEKQKTAADNTADKSYITPGEIKKEKDICSEFNQSRTQKFPEIGIRNYLKKKWVQKKSIKGE